MKKLEERIHFLCDLEVDQLLICDMTHDERTEYASLLIRLSKGIGKENCLRIQYVLTWEKDFFDMRKGRTRRLLLFVVLLGIGIIGH